MDRRRRGGSCRLSSRIRPMWSQASICFKRWPSFQVPGLISLKEQRKSSLFLFYVQAGFRSLVYDSISSLRLHLPIAISSSLRHSPDRHNLPPPPRPPLGFTETVFHHCKIRDSGPDTTTFVVSLAGPRWLMHPKTVRAQSILAPKVTARELHELSLSSRSPLAPHSVRWSGAQSIAPS